MYCPDIPVLSVVRCNREQTRNNHCTWAATVTFMHMGRHGPYLLRWRRPLQLPMRWQLLACSGRAGLLPSGRKPHLCLVAPTSTGAALQFKRCG